MEHIRCLIIGSGPAGYTAAIYAGRANLAPVLYEGIQPGGQLTTTDIVENFPSHPDGITGFELMDLMRKQALRFGTDIRSHVITKSDLSQRPYRFTADNGEELEADAVIIATGASAKYLGLPDEEKYRGQGVSACATCDGFFYRKKVVAVVGGGDTACAEATIEVLFETNTEGLYGENGVEGAHLVYRRGEADERHYDLPIDGFFLAIGHKPNSDVFKPWIDTDEVGYIKTQGDSPKTNLPGIFAAGDVADPNYRQAVVAAGSGCKAAIEVDHYLKTLQ